MTTYSLDLRQKVIDAYKCQEGSQRQLAKRFSANLSFIQDLLKRATARMARLRRENRVEELLLNSTTSKSP